MKSPLLVIAVIFQMMLSVSAAPSEIKTTKIPDAIRAQQIKDMKLGMFVCLSLSTFSGREWTRDVKSLDLFKAADVDTDQWCKAAKDAGMGYILFMTKQPPISPSA